MSALIGRSIDSVIDQMDVDRIISRIDMDRVVSRIDINKILDSVDLDRQIARVDINAILERTDINAVLERSNLEEIVARSSTGIFSQLVDFIRIYIVKLDLLLYRAGKCSCLKQEVYLPPRPGRKGRGSTTTEKQSLVAHIVQVQDAWSGVVSRGVSWLIDEIVAIVTFGAATLILQAVADMIKDDREYTIDPIVTLFMYLGWDVHLKIVCLILSRRTVGMSVVGLKVRYPVCCFPWSCRLDYILTFPQLFILLVGQPKRPQAKLVSDYPETIPSANFLQISWNQYVSGLVGHLSE